MFSFIERWWEQELKQHTGFAHWWENARTNANNVCPDWFAQDVGASLSFGAYDYIRGVNSSMGMKTDISIIHGAATKLEKLKIARTGGMFLCGGAYIGGGIDALYQQFHNDYHFATDMTDWLIHKKNTVYNWWEHEDHWWKL